MRLLRPLMLVAAAVALVAANPAGAATSRPVAVWEMNEAAGAHTMADSSGNRLNGRVGADVDTGVKMSGATGYRFGYLRPDTPPVHPGHLVTVPDSSRLDPGNRDYAITIRMRWTRSFGNVIQKGQTGAKGGYFKWQAPSGIVECSFRGSAGYNVVRSDRRLDDNRFHTIRCERTASYLALTVDGRLVASRKGATGAIDNTWPLTIAGKSRCDQVEVTCDYFPGDIDRVQIDTR